MPNPANTNNAAEVSESVGSGLVRKFFRGILGKIAEILGGLVVAALLSWFGWNWLLKGSAGANARPESPSVGEKKADAALEPPRRPNIAVASPDLDKF